MIFKAEGISFISAGINEVLLCELFCYCSGALVQEKNTMPVKLDFPHRLMRSVVSTSVVSYTFNPGSFNNWHKIVVFHT